MKKRIGMLFLAMVMLLGLSVHTAGGALAEGPFADVPEGAWYADYVEEAFETGLLAGTTDTTFSPEGTLTYAQAVTLAARLHQQLATGRVDLENGRDTVWYAPFLAYAREQGIVDSALEQRAARKGWDAPASRRDMVILFYRTTDSSSFTVINQVEDRAIPDVPQTAASEPEIYAFYRAGILTGDQYHKFNGDANVKRSEAAAILVRVLDPAWRQSVTLTASVTLPPYNAPVTQENVLALLDALDPDGAFIVRGAMNDSFFGGDVMRWFEGSPGIAEDLGTAVHEECHSYTDYDIFRGVDRFYTGGGQSVLVTRTQVFDTAEIEAVVPEELRTYRYSNYVGTSADPIMASRQFGVYGLMNEFTAYCWGSNDELCIFDYRWENGNHSVSDDYVAYAEFVYYILTYMLYARENHPEVYKGIMDNKEFLRAFTLVEEKYAQVVSGFLDKTWSMMAGSSFRRTYDKLMAEIERPEYQQMLSLMRAG